MEFLTTIPADLHDEVKMWLRVGGSNATDTEVDQTIRASLLDLQAGGVVKTDLSDALIQQAVKLYCKANFGYDEDAPKFSVAYEHLKSALGLCGEYNTKA